MRTYIECPDDWCDLAAEVVEFYILGSTDGPVRHIKTVCVLGHRYDMPERR